MQILTGVNMMSKELVLVHGEDDKMVMVPLEDLPGWRPASPQHTWITPDERTVFVATDAIPPFNASIDRVRGFKTRSDGTLDQRVRYSRRKLTRQTHGVNFNDKGTVGLGVGYDYDLGEVRVYRANRHSGEVEATHTITLGTDREYGAFAHYAAWIDDRFACVGLAKVYSAAHGLMMFHGEFAAGRNR